MYQAIYIEINTFCILILIVILFKLEASINRQVQSVAFFRVTLATFIILILDGIWASIEPCAGRAFHMLNYLVNILYLFDTGVISYFLLQYIASRLQYNALIDRPLRKVLLTPLALLLVCCVASPWTGWLFTVDAGNIYHRGPLHFIQIAISYGYLLAATVLIVLRFFERKPRLLQRATLIPLLSFSILLTLGTLLNTLWYGLPIIWPAATFALLMTFINMQNHQISTDGLTGLNNRRQFDKYLQARLSDEHRAEPFCLFLMDVDAFKSINDTYGHLTGDQALVQTAKLLQGVCRERNAFLARYGGDEFAVISVGVTKDAAKAIELSIASAFERFNASSDAPYKLTLSVGYQAYDPSQNSTAAQLISDADVALYCQKRAHKLTR